MAGMLYHMFFGKVVLDSMAVVSDLKIEDRAAFMAGNILPDMSMTKHAAHYYRQVDGVGFYLPDMAVARLVLASVENKSLRLGLEGHLYLDERFTREFLTSHFKFDAQTKSVTSVATGQTWQLGQFYSPDGLYRGYGECNPLLLQEGEISLEWIGRQVPEVLPATGIISMDVRQYRRWQDQLNFYLTEPPQYSGQIFDYEELVGFVRRCALDFVVRDASR